MYQIFNAWTLEPNLIVFCFSDMVICGIFFTLFMLILDTTILASSNYNYDHVLHLSLLYYEAQRSGYLPADNRIPWRGNSAVQDKGMNGEDLTGGYYDGEYLTCIDV